ncbi:MAG: oligosaccharide flippase family protein [Ferruginibacter sp.]
MNLLQRFKKDYFNYLVSIIIPAFINAVSIPLFKRILGPEGYGYFSISFNSLLLLASLLTSWIMQSVLRYSPMVSDRRSFVKKALLLSVITQTLFFLPTVFSVYYLKTDWLFAIIFGVSLFIVSVQYVTVSISQSFFLSGKNIFSELIRSVAYIATGLILLTATGIYYMYSLFAGIFISFLLSGLYLLVQTKKELAARPPGDADSKELRQLFRSFLSYGGPISLWFVCSYSITLVDKYFMLHSLGANQQGNYQALFDLLSRSIMLLCSPVVISLFPLITVAYQANKTHDIKRLLTKVIVIELVVLVAAQIAYWWFGASILSALIKIPATTEYKLIGELIITGAFLWQIGIVVHKYYEMKFKNGHLLAMIAIAFISQLILYWLLNKNTNPLLYPAGYVLSSLVYLMLVSAGVFRSFLSLTKNNRSLS